MAIILMLASSLSGLGIALFGWIVLDSGFLAALGLWSLGGTATFATGLAVSAMPPRGRPPRARPQPV